MDNTKCSLCGATINQKGMGKWREDIQAYEWYEIDHECPKIKDAAKYIGMLGGLMTAKKYGKKHYSEAGKKGMKSKWKK